MYELSRRPICPQPPITQILTTMAGKLLNGEAGIQNSLHPQISPSERVKRARLLHHHHVGSAVKQTMCLEIVGTAKKLSVINVVALDTKKKHVGGKGLARMEVPISVHKS